MGQDGAVVTLDPRNSNRGTERGEYMVEHSLRTYGAGRGPVADKHGVIIAGNKTVAKAMELGIPIELIESDGKTLYVIKRTDLDLSTDTAAMELGVIDNRSSEVGLQFDPDVLKALQSDGADLSAMWFDYELTAVLAGDEPTVPEETDDAAKYSTAVESPIYTPTGEQPSISDLAKTERHDQLLADINTSTISDNEKHFLRMAATRHIVFDYRRIAEFYAHADAETQRLMEDSALVIIDLNRAIELGYANLRETMLDIVEDAYDA